MASHDIHRDRTLFARIVAGEVAAFHELFELYYHPLRLNAFKLLKAEFWAEEVAQEVFLQVWDNRQQLAGIEHPAAWLYRVCANRCLDRIRRSELELRAQYLANLAMQGSAHAEIHPQYDYALLQKLIKEVVDQLPEQQRLVYNLQQEQSLSYKEIANRLGISPNTVRNHLIRAFNSIRQYIQQHGEFLALLFYLFYFF